MVFVGVLTSSPEEDLLHSQLKKLSADPFSAVENHNTGVVWYKDGKYHEAYRQFLKSFACEDDTRNESDEVLTSLGDALYQLGYLEEALKAYEQAMMKNRLNLRAIENYRITYERLMRHKNKDENNQDEKDNQKDENSDDNKDNQNADNEEQESEGQKDQDQDDNSGSNNDDQNQSEEDKNDEESLEDLEQFLRDNSPDDSQSLNQNMNGAYGDGQGGEGGDADVLP